MSGEITWPLVSNVIRRRKLSNTFGMVRKYANGTPKAHQGWDFEAAVGEPAYAIADGTVMFVRSGGDYGDRVCISFQFNGATRYAFYAHMQYISVAVGDAVKLNDYIGSCGKSGNASNLPAIEDHLHFEIRTQEDPGLGLGGRVSPFTVYGICPLNNPVPG